MYYQIVTTKSGISKHDTIRQTLIEAIASGQYEVGQRLPSESELVRTFGASRPTVNRALRDLQLSGVIERRAGSGSYVRADAVARGHVFGLLIPELGLTEIFEPICRGMAEAQHGSHHALLWGSSLGDPSNIEEQASVACRQLVAKKVSGVFFAPVELTSEKDAINRQIVDDFEKAGIAVVLLDRDLVAYPDRSKYDIVGIDNRRAGNVITAHLIKAGCRRPAFIGRARSAPTVDARISGYREALAEAGGEFQPLVFRIEPDDIAGVRDLYGALPASDFGSVQGRVTKDGRGVYGAHVVAASLDTGALVASYTLTATGEFVIAGLPPGTYVLRAEPLDDVDVESVFGGAAVDIAFRPAYARRLAVVQAGGATSVIAIEVTPK